MGVAAWLRKALGWPAPPLTRAQEREARMISRAIYGTGDALLKMSREDCAVRYGTVPAAPTLNVVPIKPLVDEVVVERLERLLARAKAGQIQFIAYAVEMRNGSFATNWAGQGRRTNLETASMIAQLEFEFRLGIANSDEVPFDPLPPAS